MTNELVEREDRLAEVRAALISMSAEVLIGVQRDEGSKASEVRTAGGSRAGSANAITVAEKAQRNEFGLGVPERPAFRAAFDNKTQAFIRRLTIDLGKVVDGGLSIDQALDRVGELGKGFVQQSITDLRDPPNAESTIAAKGSANPLIDTGQLRQAIRYRVIANGVEGVSR